MEESEEELESFDDLETEEDEEDLTPPARIKREMARPIARPSPIKQQLTKKKVVEPEEETEEEVEVEPEAKPQAPQYVQVPRAVPIETMLNEIFDGQQELKQILVAIYQKLNK